MNPMKRSFTSGDGRDFKRRGKKRQKVQKDASKGGQFEGTHDEVLSQDIRALRLADDPNPSVSDRKQEGFERFQEVEVNIERISSTGEGLGRIGEDVLVVPFTVPGDRVLAKIIRRDGHGPSSSVENYWITDFVKVVEASPRRDDGLVKCKYFSTCSGCQFQMLPYATQLQHKQRVVEKAFANFSGLSAQRIPSVEETIGSPLQYGYRTKLTPHFPAPQGARRAGRKGERAHFTECPPIGFMKKGTQHTLDIEECPIGTAAVQLGLRRERARVKQELHKYSRGATILLRESTSKVPRTEAGDVAMGIDEERQVVYEKAPAHGAGGEEYVYAKTCTSENTGISTEYVDGMKFENRANSFFQNNNSILPTFVAYIRDRILPRPSPDGAGKKITSLIDAYCGSGLFTVMLSSLFERSIGIDIDHESIAFAQRNAKSNRLVASASAAAASRSSSPPLSGPPVGTDGNASIKNKTAAAAAAGEDDRVRFMAGTASALFSSASHFDPSATVVVIDPPRKGCDEEFLQQLVQFRPARIVYVSCNVHTQARDIGWLLDAEIASITDSPGVSSLPSAAKKYEYVIESLVGFDFFPQTGHVEGVAVLSLQESS